MKVLILAALVAAVAVNVEGACTGARITPGVGTITLAGATYRIDAARAILRNNVPLGGGYGTVLVVTNGELQTLGTDGGWWRFGTVWSATNAGDPCPPVVVEALPRLSWEQPANSLAEAKTFSYRLYRDGSKYAILLQNVLCTGAGPFVCTAAVPSTTVGPHTFRVTATNALGESGQSVALPVKVSVQ